MASIRKRGRGYHVQIRKNGYQTITHTLSSLSLARKKNHTLNFSNGFSTKCQEITANSRVKRNDQHIIADT